MEQNLLTGKGLIPIAQLVFLLTGPLLPYFLLGSQSQIYFTFTAKLLWNEYV